MARSQFELANTLAVLSGGRNPQWVEQTSYAGAPQNAGAGVYLEDALRTLVDIRMREDVHRRTARVTVTTLVLASNYTVTINGTACTATGPFADLDELLTDLAAAINGSGESGNVTASVTDEDEDGTDDTVKIVGDNETDFSIDISATGGAALACEADPSTATAQIYVAKGGTNAPSGWTAPLNCEFSLDKLGLSERFDTAGLDRMYVGLTSIDGHASDGATVTYNPTVHIGPCVTE